MKVESDSDLDIGITKVPETTGRKPGIVPKMWSKEEDKLLRESIAKYGEKSWKLVAENVPGRTYIQCLQRWKKALKPGLKKGHWSPEEDEVLKALISKYSPNLDWATIAKSVEGRSAKQCRERWFLNLDPSINHGPWTAEEDHALMEFVRLNGGKWSLIAKHMPGRTENSVKTRYYSLQRKQARCKAWSDDEDDVILDHVLTYGRDFDSLDKVMKHRTKGQIKKRFSFLIKKQPQMLGQISRVEKQLRRKRRMSEPHDMALARAHSSASSELFKMEKMESSSSDLLQLPELTSGNLNEEMPKKAHTMRKTISQTILQDILKPDQVMPLSSVDYNVFNEPEDMMRPYLFSKPLQKQHSLEYLNTLLSPCGDGYYSY